MKPALLKQPNNETLLKSKKSERKGAKFMLQNLMPLIRMRIADLTRQSASLLWCDFFRAIDCR